MGNGHLECTRLNVISQSDLRIKDCGPLRSWRKKKANLLLKTVYILSAALIFGKIIWILPPHNCVQSTFVLIIIHFLGTRILFFSLSLNIFLFLSILG